MREIDNLWNPAQLAARINHDGFAVVENFVQYDSLKNAQNFVRDAGSKRRKLPAHRRP
jgi:hypothetical protein